MTISQPEAPEASQQPPAYTPTSTPAPAQGKGLAIAALVVGIVAFLTGLVPFLGLILGLAAVVLGVIALVKRQPKGLAITGTALGAVALIVSLIATLVAGALTAAVVGAASEVAEQAEVTAPGVESDGEEASDQGTRENPYPLGTMVSSDEWDVTITSFTPNVTDEVAAANTFNEAAPAGSQYAMIEASATYKGADESTSMFVGIDYITADGTIISTWDSLVVGIEPKFGQTSMYAGGTDAGKLVFLIPSDADGVLRVTPGMFADDVFIAIS